MIRNLRELLFGVLVFGCICPAARGQGFVAPSSGNLYIKCVGGSAGATSEFGTGTTQANFMPLLSHLPTSCPTAEVLIGPVSAGQTLHFGISTAWNNQTYWAFSSETDEASLVAFTDVCNKVGGRAVQQTSSSTWVMHLNDAAHYTISQCEANNILIQLRLAVSPAPQLTPDVLIAQINDAATEKLAQSYLIGAYDLAQDSGQSCGVGTTAPVQLEQIFSNYVKAHPELLRADRSAAGVAAQAFAEYWPCQKQ